MVKLPSAAASDCSFFKSIPFARIRYAIAETGIPPEEIEFLNQVRALQNRFGKSALTSSTELLKTVEKMLLASFGEASK